MAKAKTQKRKQTKTQTQTRGKARKGKAKELSGTLPNGYKVIGRAPNWDPEKDSVVEGKRGPTREITMDEGKKKERTLRNCIVQDDTLGAVTVWESGMLRDFFDDTEDGDMVRIEFLGFGKAKPGQNAPKLFSVGKKDD